MSINHNLEHSTPKVSAKSISCFSEERLTKIFFKVNINVVDGWSGGLGFVVVRLIRLGFSPSHVCFLV